MFKGSIPALVTPFRDGKVDEAALVALVNWHVAEGSHGIVAVGTTGETPTLSHAEHERCIEVISEASRHLPDHAKADHPDVPWRDVAGIGNIFRHEYHNIASRIVWDTVRVHLPTLESAVRAIAAELPADDEPSAPD